VREKRGANEEASTAGTRPRFSSDGRYREGAHPAHCSPSSCDDPEFDLLPTGRFVPLPKSATPARIRSNAQVYDFALDDEDMAALDALDRGKEGAVTWNPVEHP
jgi:hypothetical protein